MIVPWLQGLQDLHRAPLTWCLIAMNIFFFLITSEPAGLDRRTKVDEPFLEMTGRIYLLSKNNWNLTTPLPASSVLVRWGSRGLHDHSFIEKILSQPFPKLGIGDELAMKTWHEKLGRFENEILRRNLSVFGFTFRGWDRFSVVTYQFMHAGLIHLLGNLLLILIFGAAVERRVGSVYLLGIYLISGIGAALIFQWLTPPSPAPMVGASGALSGLIGFYWLMERKKRVSFFYFLSPFPGHFGWVYLSKHLLLPLCFASDLASFLSNAPELGWGVAYGAHLGGLACGVALAGLFNAARVYDTRWAMNFRTQ